MHLQNMFLPVAPRHSGESQHHQHWNLLVILIYLFNHVIDKAFALGNPPSQSMYSRALFQLHIIPSVEYLTAVDPRSMK